MIVLKLLIAASWLVLLIDSVLQGIEFPALLAGVVLPELPLWLMVTGCFTIPFVISGLTYWRRENVMERIPKVTDWIDRWVFEGAYEYFMNCMYPVHASMISSALFGGVAGWMTYTSAATSPEVTSSATLFMALMGAAESWQIWSYAICAGCFVFVFTMSLAVALSRRYPPLLK